jgi:glycogen debranching enzyme
MDDHAADLTEHQHHRKEQLLTEHQASHIAVENAIVLKHGELFLLSQRGGEVPWELPHAYGLFLRDNRYLDGLQLRLNGKSLTSLSAIDARRYRVRHYLSNPDLPCAGGEIVERSTIEVRRDRVIRGETFYEMLTLTNYGSDPAPLVLEICFRAGFEDLFILKGFMDEPRGELGAGEVHGDSQVRLHYDAVDGTHLSTTLAFEPAPASLQVDQARYEFKLEPRACFRVALTVRPCQSSSAEQATLARPRDPDLLARMLQRSARLWRDSVAHVQSSNETFDRVFERAVSDLSVLRSRIDGIPYFVAGVPWFVTLFGRDAAICGLQTLPFGARTAGDSARLLARYQADRVDAFRDAEPGKILHELRRGELSRAGEIPQSPAYYGTVDATPLFLRLIAEYVDWSGDVSLAHELRGNIDRALGWIDNYGDHDGDGYLDYVGKYSGNLINQGWKDAGNSIVHADGSMPEPPIAIVEAQAYVYRAWLDTARLLRLLDDEPKARELEERAAELKERFDRDFWSDDIGFYLVGRERGGRPIASITSNAGHVLESGIAPEQRARVVAARLLQDDMYSGWGVRTLSSKNPAYNPMGYHLGSVWPHDNALLIAGLCRYRCFEPALELFSDLIGVATHVEEFRLPELFCGHPREPGQLRPVPYPVACIPHAWAAGSVLHTLAALLGLRANAPQRKLAIVRPQLPSWLDQLRLDNVVVGDATVDLQFTRRDGNAAVKHEVKSGRVDIEVES